MTRPAADKGWQYLLALIIPIFIQAQVADTSAAEEAADTISTRSTEISLLTPLFHNPPVAVLNDRPFRMDLFVNFDPEEIEKVALLFRTDSIRNFKEIPLGGEYYRYRYLIPKEELQGGAALTYYFLVTLKDYRLYAYPKDSLDQPDPFVIDLVPPTKEFFQKHLYD
jgi:hypothetical protein